MCTPHNNAARCSCIEPYFGDPYTTGCRPECIHNSECPSSLACIKQHCRNPCTAACGANAECAVVNHLPTCSCTRGFEGDPFVGCKRVPIVGPVSVCEPNPCGPNSICRTVEGHPTCSCQVGYFGAPPQCRPECVVSSECAQHLACINQKCADPCAETCGFNAKCQVNNHNPICSCPANYIGDPFEQCLPKRKYQIVIIPEILLMNSRETSSAVEPPRNVDPCLPSPCGPNANCRNVNNRAECSCAAGMFGAPPNCRPECVINQDCPSNRACIRQRCEDPCIGICGFNALCSTQNHQPKCSCIEGFEGDPYTACRMRESEYIFSAYLLSFPRARTWAREPLPLMLNVPFSGALDVLGLWYTSYACSSYCVHMVASISIYIFILLCIPLLLSIILVMYITY